MRAGVYVRVACVLLVAICPLAAASEAAPKPERVAKTPIAQGDSARKIELAERWGIELVSLRPTAAGHMLDLRYRVLDADKASALFGPGVEISLFDAKSGATLKVPSPPKIGRMRQNAGTPIIGRTYFALFVNPGRSVQSGQTLGVAIGDLRVDGVPVL